MFVSLKSDLSVESTLASTAARSMASRCECCEESPSPTPVKAEKTSENPLAQALEVREPHLGVP